MNCRYCQGRCIRKGKYKSVQKYRCITCHKFQRAIYRQQSHDSQKKDQVRILNNEGVGICSIGRILQIPPSSVLMLLVRACENIVKPIFKDWKQSYEVDELFTYIGNKQRPCYIIYAINRRTREIVDFVVGSRTKENIEKVVASLLTRSPKKIFTDGLPVYKNLIPSTLHGRSQFKTNRIERRNLTVRTHLKRLQRKTICFSRSGKMLEPCFQLYAWGC